jgi:hypothetical protein
MVPDKLDLLVFILFVIMQLLLVTQSTKLFLLLSFCLILKLVTASALHLILASFDLLFDI